MSGGKYYVVWEGLAPGIYPTWEECRAQIEGFRGAKYKAFSTREDAIMAFRGNEKDELGILQSIATHPSPGGVKAEPSQQRFLSPEIDTSAIAVDGACAGNPGPVEYRGVHVGTGREIFKVGPLPGGTNNIGEYLALVHALAMLEKRGDTTTAIYVDSRTSLSWLRNRGSRTKIQPDAGNARTMELLRRADRWVQTHPYIPNRILKWKTDLWGEIPADFGRK